MKIFAGLLLFLVDPSVASAQYVDTSMYVPDNVVTCYAENDTTLFMGGSFSSFGPYEPYGEITDTVAGVRIDIPNPNDYVAIAVTDGNGGWFIGGDFTKVGSVARNRLAHIDSAGTVLPWNPNVNNTVRTILISGDTLYFGGDFSQVGNQQRNGAAAILISSGVLTSWDPNVTGSVARLGKYNNSVFLGGTFTAISNITRNRLAVVDAVTGSLGAWNPTPNGPVKSLLVSGNQLYVGGSFSTISSTARANGAGYDLPGLTLNAWSPNTDGGIYAICYYNNMLFIGGSFSYVNSLQRRSLAQVSSSTGNVVSGLQAQYSAFVSDICPIGNRLLIVGLISNVNGQKRLNAADIDIVTGTPGNWTPDLGSSVTTAAISGAKVFLGGGFPSVNAIQRISLAAIDKRTGTFLPFAPVSGTVNTMVLVDSILYIGGSFTSIDSGVFRNYLGAFNIKTGTPTGWNPNASNTVNAMVYDGSQLYVGGAFTSIGIANRGKVAGLYLSNDTVTSWEPPSVNGTEVNCLAKVDSILYVGGNFQFISSSISYSRNRLVAYHTGFNDSVTSWNPNANGTVKFLQALGNRILVQGNFNQMSGHSRNGLAMVDVAGGGLSQGFNPVFDNSVYGCWADGPVIYVSGAFTSCNSVPKNHVAAINAYNGANVNVILSTNGYSALQRIYVSDGWMYFSYLDLKQLNNADLNDFGRVRVGMNYQVKGKVWFDDNGNGVHDTLEYFAVNYPIFMQPGNYWTMTDMSGNYTVFADSGQYTVSPVLAQYVSSCLPMSYSIYLYSSNPVDSLNDFGLVQQPGINDLSIVVTPTTVPRANGQRNYDITCRNNGSSAQPVYVKLEDDTVHLYSYCTIPVDSLIADSLYLTQGLLAPSHYLNFAASYHLQNYPIGTPLLLSATVSSLQNDTTPNDNRDSASAFLTYSHDPNYKEVIPSETYVPLVTEELEYIIHFQNTGNDTAFNVVLIDTLSGNLDPSSFVLLAGSHPCNVSIHNHVMVVSFDSIMLPDSTTNEVESHGYLHYKLRLVTGLSTGSIIQNTAYIFFDLNAPVVTNTTTTILLNSVITIVNNQVSDNLFIYPIPACHTLTLRLRELIDNYHVEIFNIAGVVIYVADFRDNKQTFDLSGLTDGVYFISVTSQSDGSTETRKFILINSDQ